MYHRPLAFQVVHQYPPQVPYQEHPPQVPYQQQPFQAFYQQYPPQIFYQQYYPPQATHQQHSYYESYQESHRWKRPKQRQQQPAPPPVYIGPDDHYTYQGFSHYDRSELATEARRREQHYARRHPRHHSDPSHRRPTAYEYDVQTLRQHSATHRRPREEIADKFKFWRADKATARPIETDRRRAKQPEKNSEKSGKNKGKKAY